jgi:ACS family hexuronate transporter-like MFS transporter
VTPSPGAAAPAPPVGYYRWVICALLFFASAVNYVDRQVIGILKPTLQHEFQWSELDYANIVFAFQLAYAIGFLIAGRVIDRVGTKIGFTLAIVIWSVAAITHAEAVPIGEFMAPLLGLVGVTASASVAGFMTARFVLGIGESGNFPAAVKTVAEWFPKKERALATGIFNGGTNLGAIITPLVVPWITLTYGWYWAFVVTGVLGFAWLAFWLLMYAPVGSHPRVTPAEVAYINADREEPTTPLPLRAILSYRQTWAFVIAKFLTDSIWWLYLYWVPDFLSRNHGLDLKTMGLPIVVIYVVADVGSIGGGWLSSTLLGRGWNTNWARKTAMLTCALCAVPIMFASGASQLWLAVALVSVAAAGHQGWSANLYTLASDLFPKRAVATLVGLGGTAGAIGGLFIAKITGYVLEFTGSYLTVFLIAGSTYLVALAIVHLMMPRLAPAPID